MKKLVLRTALLVAGLLGTTMAYLTYLQVSGNFYEVSEKVVFRAAQMDGQKLAQWKREHGIASVLNLRGENNGADWYETERAVADRLGIQHIDFRMSAQEELTDAEVHALLDVMRDAPKPLLIHCKAGADRTGIASALYLAGIAGRAEKHAERHLSIEYGHIGLPWISQAWAMNET